MFTLKRPPQRRADTPDLLLTRQVADAICRAALQGRARGAEAGGSLLAWEGEGAPLLAYALPTGDAEASWSHIRTDAARQSAWIDTLLARVPGLRYVGDWHIHPMWLPDLSATDRATAAAILHDEAAGRERLLLLLGSVQPDGMAWLGAFGAARPTWGALAEITPLTFRVVEDDAPEVRARLGGPLPPLGGLLADAAAPVLAGDGRRLALDLAELEARLGLTWEACRVEGCTAVVVRRGALALTLLVPPEYPLNPPDVLLGDLESPSLRPLHLGGGWSSLHSLADRVQAALDLLSAPPVPSPHNAPFPEEGAGRATFAGLCPEPDPADPEGAP